MKRGAINPGAVVVLLAMLGSLMFYVVEVSPGEREALIEGVEYSNMLLDVSPGIIKELEEIDIEKTTRSVGTVEINNVPIEEVALLSNQLFVKRSAFSDEPATIGFKAVDLGIIEQATLTAFVSDSRGSLSITLNGKPLFSSVVYPGQQITVPVDAENLNEGFNELKFSVTGPGIEFWRNNFYLLSAVNIITLSYPEEEAIATQTFVLREEEIEEADEVEFDSFILQTSMKPAKVSVLLNDNLLYESEVRTKATVSVPVPITYLNVGTNQLVWMVEKDGAYKVSFVRVILESLALEDLKFYTFDISAKDWSRIHSTKVPSGLPAYGCYLNLTRSTGGKSITVRVNSQSFIRSFGEQDELSVNVCEAMKEGPNTVSLAAEDAIFIDRLTFELKGI
jgi:hypothetical protein